MPRPGTTLSQPESTQQVLQRLAPMIALALLIGGAVLYLQFKGSRPPAKKQRKQIQLDPPKPAPKQAPAPLPLPAELLARVEDRTLLDDEKEPAHDRLRAYVNSFSLQEIERRARPETGLARRIKELRGKFVELRGKLVRIKTVPVHNRPSGVELIEQGELVTPAGESVMFETVTANIHGVDRGEQLVLRGACYKLANVPEGKHRILPYLIAKQIVLDYRAYIPRIRDGKAPPGAGAKDPEDYYYYVLMRKVRFDRPDQLAADRAPTPAPSALAGLAGREKLRGKYVRVAGKLLDVQKVDLGSNRAYISEVWRGKLQAADGTIWCFDSLGKPAYIAFLREYGVALTGAFARTWSWTDAKGRQHKSPYLVTRLLDLAADKPSFRELPGMLDGIKDGGETRDIHYFYLLHRLTTLDHAAIEKQTRKEFSVGDVVTKELRDKLRGQFVETSGKLLKVQRFELPAERRLNPSGVTSLYRCFLATSRPTIYTVDVLEQPALRPGQEATVQGAFWKVYAYETRTKGQTEKSPYLLARRLVLRPQPRSAAHDQLLAIVIGLMLVLIVFLFFVGRAELRKASQFREELRRRRTARGIAAAPAQGGEQAPPPPPPESPGGEQ